tara:strand:- start:1523 stop:2194 length:672 start_codon:yes stop_codon:yes gene_type:complete
MIFNPLQIISGIGQGVAGLYQMKAAKDERKYQRDIESKARTERDRIRAIYEDLDTSNPYLNMENTMEDLTINQKQAQFEKETFQQSQANIMQTLQSAAGSSGIASLAQSLSQQGQLAAQRSAASIGQQESRNIMAERGQAAKIQQMERAGQSQQQQLELQKHGSLQQMSHQEMAQAGAAAHQSEMQRMQALGGVVGGFGSAAGGFFGTEDQLAKGGGWYDTSS